MMTLGRKIAAQVDGGRLRRGHHQPAVCEPLDAGVTEFLWPRRRGHGYVRGPRPYGRLWQRGVGTVHEKRVTTPVVQVGWPDQFIEHATNVDDLRRRHGLTVENTVSRIKALLSEEARLSAGRISRLCDY